MSVGGYVNNHRQALMSLVFEKVVDVLHVIRKHTNILCGVLRNLCVQHVKTLNLSGKLLRPIFAVLIRANSLI
jgi:hypothetical protein